MKSECAIVQDLIPLYVDGILKRDTTEYVEQHLKGCGKCRNLHRELEQNSHWKPIYGLAAEVVRHDLTKEEQKFIEHVRSWRRKSAAVAAGILVVGYAVIQLW